MYQGSFFHHYQILINPTQPLAYTRQYPTYFYNTPAHLAQQPCLEPVSFFLVHTKKQRIEAIFHLFIIGQEAQSPCQAPFGGLEFNSMLHLEVLQFFWESIEAFLATQHLTQLKIKLYPACYHPENTQLLQYLWLKNGFEITEYNLNYHIKVDDTPLHSKMHASEKRRLRKCYAQEYQFEVWNTPDFAFAHRFVQACRARKGYPVSLSESALQKLYRQFPAHFTMFTLKDQEQVIALATGVKVNEDILYYFLPADDAAYLMDSPMVRLLEGMYAYAQQHNYQLLDLGISTEFSQANYGLINFKKNMGAETSLKFTFLKQF